MVVDSFMALPFLNKLNIGLEPINYSLKGGATFFTRATSGLTCKLSAASTNVAMTMT